MQWWLKFGRDFKVELWFWPRFWNWSLVEIVKLSLINLWYDSNAVTSLRALNPWVHCAFGNVLRIPGNSTLVFSIQKPPIFCRKRFPLFHGPILLNLSLKCYFWVSSLFHELQNDSLFWLSAINFMFEWYRYLSTWIY